MILALEEVLEIDSTRPSLVYLPLGCCYAERSRIAWRIKKEEA
jgi:hypothetical protein